MSDETGWSGDSDGWVPLVPKTELDAALAELAALKARRCETCRHLIEQRDDFPRCGRQGCPAFAESVDEERFCCVCWAAREPAT
jgi:hypothetical protein